MDRIDKCSYSKVGKVLKDSEITCDPTNSSTLSPTHAMPTSNDTDIEEMPMVEFGKKLVGTHYDQQLGYGYREIYQGNNIRLKLYKKVVLMDKVCYEVSLVSHARYKYNSSLRCVKDWGHMRHAQSA